MKEKLFSVKQLPRATGLDQLLSLQCQSNHLLHHTHTAGKTMNEVIDFNAALIRAVKSRKEI
jgi:hypothetical protein